MKSKKLISLLVGLVLLMSIFSMVTIPVNAAAPTATLEFSSANAAPGSSVNVYLKLKGSFASLKGTVTWDKAKMDYVSMDKASTSVPGILTPNNGTKPGLFTLVDVDNMTFSGGNVIKITFKIKDSATGESKVSIDESNDELEMFHKTNPSDTQFEPVQATIKSGSVTISPAATKITPSQTKIDITKGKSVQLTYSMTPTNAGDSVSFSSNNSNVASVDSKTGKITGKASGTATITISGAKVKATCEVTVHNYVSLRVNNKKAINNGIKTTVDSSGTAPYIYNSRTMLPLRFVGEKMGGTVQYYNLKSPIVMTYGDKKVEFLLNSKTMTIYSGTKKTIKTLDVPAIIKNSKTYIPIRAIADALGFTVYYQDGTQIIIINTPFMSNALRDVRLAEAKAYIK